MMSAFVYIAGLPMIGFDYLARVLVAYPLIMLLVRRNLMAPPGYMRSVIETFQHRRPILNEGHIDDWALLAVGTTSFTVRALVFSALTGPSLRINAIVAIAAAEAVGHLYSVLVNLALPLPTSAWARDAVRAWIRDGVRAREGVATRADLDPRLDELIIFGLCQPPLIFLIYYSYLVHGLAGAVVWSTS